MNINILWTHLLKLSLILFMALISYPFNRQFHKMVKHTQTIQRQIADELFSVFDHFVGLALKGLNQSFPDAFSRHKMG